MQKSVKKIDIFTGRFFFFLQNINFKKYSRLWRQPLKATVKGALPPSCSLREGTRMRIRLRIRWRE